MTTLAKAQRGSTLLVSLMLLIVLTFIVFSAIQTSTTSTRIVGNIQDRLTLEATMQNAIEVMMSDVAYFTTDLDAKYVTQEGEVVTLAEGEEAPDGTISIDARSCFRALPADGDSIVENTTPGKQYTMWEVSAHFTDADTGASAHIHQGVKVLLPFGNCKQPV